MTKLCIKILVEADSAIESAFPYYMIFTKDEKPMNLLSLQNLFNL